MVRRAPRNEERNDSIPPSGLFLHRILGCCVQLSPLPIDFRIMPLFFLIHRGGFRDYDCELGTRNHLLEEF
jgi:hypothetical protein